MHVQRDRLGKEFVFVLESSAKFCTVSFWGSVIISSCNLH